MSVNMRSCSSLVMRNTLLILSFSSTWPFFFPKAIPAPITIRSSPLITEITTLLINIFVIFMTFTLLNKCTEFTIHHHYINKYKFLNILSFCSYTLFVNIFVIFMTITLLYKCTEFTIHHHYINKYKLLNILCCCSYLVHIVILIFLLLIQNI